MGHTYQDMPEWVNVDNIGNLAIVRYIGKAPQDTHDKIHAAHGSWVGSALNAVPDPRNYALTPAEGKAYNAAQIENSERHRKNGANIDRNSGLPHNLPLDWKERYDKDRRFQHPCNILDICC